MKLKLGAWFEKICNELNFSEREGLILFSSNQGKYVIIVDGKYASEVQVKKIIEQINNDLSKALIF